MACSSRCSAGETSAKPTASAQRTQSAGAAFKEAIRYPSFLLLTAGYFVCGFQVVFIGVHMPSYLKDHGMSPQVASYALALIGLFNVFGTYIAGTLGQRMPKHRILAFIYFARAVVIAIFVIVPLSPLSVYVFSAVIGAHPPPSALNRRTMLASICPSLIASCSSSESWAVWAMMTLLKADRPVTYWS